VAKNWPPPWTRSDLMPYLLNALSMLVQVVFGAIATLFLCRVAAEATRADFHNPLSQFIYRYTNPVLAPVRRILPNWRRINLAALLVVWLTFLIERLVISALAGFLPSPLGLLVLSLADLLDFVLLFYIVLIFGWSILSMLSVDPYQPLMRLAGAIVQPLLRPLRGKLTVGSIDFSPTVVVIALLLARILVAAPLFDLGARLAQGG
jgi:YggT family protein